MRQTLSRLNARENAVVACIDDGCGKEEDLVGMMSLSNGVIKIEMGEGKRILNVVIDRSVCDLQHTGTDEEPPLYRKGDRSKSIICFIR